ncbi:MAG: hypothetical protein O3A63_20395 [Proteobacteria bacterium]|nr:hypothetical protein [Pseudomonadota bacterium]
MLLQPGEWYGKGSLLTEGASLGEALVCNVIVVADEGGFTLTGQVTAEDRAASQLSIRIAPNEVGTYTMDARVGAAALDGIAKLESIPNLGLLWNEAQTLSSTFTLFNVANGFGFRGFVRENQRTLTWEIAFHLKQDVIKGDNVVSLHRRRR